jgi:hypothetical protein
VHADKEHFPLGLGKADHEPILGLALGHSYLW